MRFPILQTKETLEIPNHYLKFSADQGRAEAQFKYGVMLFYGDGISMNKSLAAHYFKLSADQGQADAQFNFGVMLFHGDGISMNKSLAAHYLKLSADQGKADAQFNFGVMLFYGDGVSMNKSLAVHYLKLSADRGLSLAAIRYADLLLSGEYPFPAFGECEKYLRLAVSHSSIAGKMRLALCLLSGLFGRFGFTEARYLFEDLSDSNRFALILRDSLSPSEFRLVLASDFSVDGNLFSFFRSSIDDRMAAARSSFVYLVNLSQAESHVFQTSPTDLLLCSSISEMTQFLCQMYTVESLLYKNVNIFLRYFPIWMVSKFMAELKGLVSYLYLLQLSIAFRSRGPPLREDLVVYRRVEQCYEFVQLYESIIGDVFVWPGFTSTSTGRDSVLNHFVTDENSVLFEIELHPGDVVVRIEK
jgi:hypothetical protein